MTYTEIASMVEGIGIPSAYDHFAEGESPPPPFVLFLLPSTNNFMADGEVYEQVTEVSIELYTDLKMPPLEAQVERVLRAHDITWDKTEVWIEDEKLFEVRYELNVLYEEEDPEAIDASTSDSIDSIDASANPATSGAPDKPCQSRQPVPS